MYMIRATLQDLSWKARMAMASMLSVSNTLEDRALGEQRLADLRDERPDLVHAGKRTAKVQRRINLPSDPELDNTSVREINARTMARTTRA